MNQLTLILALAIVPGCTGKIMEPAAEPPPPVDPMPEGHPPITGVDVDTTDPTPSGLASDAHRPRRRMDLDQLDASVRRVTGGIGWTEGRAPREVNVFTQLGATLGRPDWIEITDEDLEPSALFQKFLDDMARSVCTRLADAERTRPAADRTLLVHADLADTVETARPAIDRNLSALLLAYHGRAISTDSRELDPWRDLFVTATVAAEPADPVEGWRAVCVGLITHPDFYSY